MQTITITPQIENGRFLIDLPENFSDAEFVIQIIVKNAKMERKDQPQLIENKIDKVRSFAGIARDSNYLTDEAQWYQQ